MQSTVIAPSTFAHSGMIFPAIMPVPSQVAPMPGFFEISAHTVIVADKSSEKTARQLAEYLAPATGFSLKIESARNDANGSIVLSQDSSLAHLGDEGYELVVSDSGIQMRAPTQAGLFYAVQTFRQLLPTKIFTPAIAGGVRWNVPCVKIQDSPRFKWRGLMLDSGHDFQTMEFVFRFIDLMAMHKFNILHWHLTDMGTWAIEIKKHPKLTDPSTRRPGVKAGYYTQDQIREVIAYAAEHHITIIPEIDMPGHSTPAITAYPELNCPVPFRPSSPDRQRPWEGKPWEYCVGNEKLYPFLEDVLNEVIALFPSKYVHIGGDESPKGRWAQCPICQAKKKAENLKDEDELQSYFIRRIETFLNSKGRSLIGWDEILEGGLAPNASVMVWRGDGIAAATEAAKANHDVIMAPNEHVYFDYYQSEDKTSDPQAAHGITPLEKVYAFEPIPAAISAEHAKHILGAQGQMWTDTHPREENIDWLMWPRTCALSEVVWSAASIRNYEEFFKRMTVHEERLAGLGVHYRPLATISSPVAR